MLTSLHDLAGLLIAAEVLGVLLVGSWLATVISEWAGRPRVRHHIVSTGAARALRESLRRTS